MKEGNEEVMNQGSSRGLIYIEIHSYIDGELSPDRMNVVESLIKSNETYSHYFFEMKGLTEKLATMPSLPTPENGWKNCASRIKELERVQKTNFLVGKYAWATCAGILALIMGGSMLNRFEWKHNIGTGDMPGMAAGLISTPSQVGQSGLADWLQSKLGHSSVQPPQSLQIRSAQAGYFEGRREVRLNFNGQGGASCLFIVQDNQSIDGVQPVPMRQNGGPQLSVGHAGDWNCVTWKMGEFSFLLFGHQNTDQLCQEANQIVSARN